MSPGPVTAVTFGLLGILLSCAILFELLPDLRADLLHHRLSLLLHRINCLSRSRGTEAHPAEQSLRLMCLAAINQAASLSWLPLVLSPAPAPAPPPGGEPAELADLRTEFLRLILHHLALGAPWLIFSLARQNGRRAWATRVESYLSAAASHSAT